MASNHAYSPRLSPSEPPSVEDCRDYLRTGRCKYGASCKFNHPPNVQSGGGMKAPMDPSEPMFPLRPTEPICQYYMKHGTCKFGQACKFHHPPQSGMKATTFLAGGNTVVLNGDAASVPQHILLNAVDSSSSSTMMLQFLPQRPEEPDCIYFLRNGRCKYGATCRYHHPVGYHQGRQGKAVETVRTAPVQIQLPAQVTSDGTVLASQLVDSSTMGSKVQYVTSLPANSATVAYTTSQTQTRIISKSNGGHVLVSESPVRRSSSNSNQYIHMSHQDVGVEYQTPVGEPLGGPMGLSQEHASSSSSIASSYETAVSSFDGNGRSEATSAPSQWTRSMRSNSTNNLHSYTNSGVRGSQVRIGSSESNLQSRNMRHRAASFGSVSEVSETGSQVYHDAMSTSSGLDRSSSLGWSGAPQSLPTHLEKGSYMIRNANDAPPGMDMHRTRSATYRSDSSSYGSGYDDGSSTHPEYMPQGMPPRKVTVSSRRQGGEGVDQGLSMMTSALLTMLDTPEEAPMKMNPASRETSSSTLHPSPPVTPRSANTLPTNDPVSLDEQLMPPSTGYARDHRAGYVYAAPSHQEDLYASRQPQQQRYAPQLSSSAPSYSQPSTSRISSFSGSSPARDEVVDSRWSPTWHQHQPHQVSHQHQENLSIGMQAPKRHHGSLGSHQETSDVGLYLP